MDETEAARLLSLEEDEVADVADSPAGVVVKTAEGVDYVVVGEDNPDAEGKHGVMFLAAPSANYGGTFPVYAQPGASQADVEKDLDVELATPAPPAEGDPAVAHPGQDDVTASVLASTTTPLGQGEAEPAPGPAHDQAVADANAPQSAGAPPNQPPRGSAREVKAWVGDDKDRAGAALAAERSSDRPRADLVSWLESAARD